MQKRIKTLTNIANISSFYVETLKKEKYAFLEVKPTNITVLSPMDITARINALLNVLKGTADVSFFCLNSRENYEQNKNYLLNKMENEPSEILQRQLQNELDLYTRQEMEIASAREFYITVKLPTHNEKEVLPYLHQVEKIAATAGFHAATIPYNSIKRLLITYFDPTDITENLEDIDGQQWAGGGW